MLPSDVHLLGYLDGIVKRDGIRFGADMIEDGRRLRGQGRVWFEFQTVGSAGQTHVSGYIVDQQFSQAEECYTPISSGLNIIVGPNTIGKTAVVDALRALLAGADDPYPKFTQDDLHIPKGGEASSEIAGLLPYGALICDALAFHRSQLLG